MMFHLIRRAETDWAARVAFPEECNGKNEILVVGFALAAPVKSTVAWVSASLVLVLAITMGVFVTDGIRDANGDRLPVFPVVLVTSIYILLLKKLFDGRHRR